jgi:N-acetyl-gamma-glutamyl-phosphate reductase
MLLDRYIVVFDPFQPTFKFCKLMVVSCKEGFTGSGRTLSLGTHFPEANESVKAYRLNNHPHSYEAAMGIQLFTGKKPNITFTPHMVPMQRGILITAYAQLNSMADYDKIKSTYKKYYSDKPFIRILNKGIYVETKWVRCSNMCHINFEINERTNKLVLVAAIDNLIKGAAGQAIQNMNIMNDYPQDAGLTDIPVCI